MERSKHATSSARAGHHGSSYRAGWRGGTGHHQRRARPGAQRPPLRGGAGNGVRSGKGQNRATPSLLGHPYLSHSLPHCGHCTELLLKEDLPTYVSFDPTYKPGASKLIRGTPYIHPKACLAAKEGCVPDPLVGQVTGYPRYDAGVVVLKKPVRMATYGTLPKAGLVDTLKEDQRLTAVGYGVNGFERVGEAPLPQPIFLDDRYRATVRLLDTKDPALGEMF